MGLLGKKEKNKPQRYSLKDKLFPVSKPWGYSPQHVEDAIKGYTKVIEQQKQAINELRLELSTEKNARAKVENEFRNLQLQMSLTQAPNLNDIQEEFIQDKFKQQFKQSDNKPHRTNKNDLINSEMSKPAPKNYFKDSNYNETRSSDDIINELFTGTGDDNDDGSDSENESDPDSYRQQSLNNSNKTSLSKNEVLQQNLNEDSFQAKNKRSFNTENKSSFQAENESNRNMFNSQQDSSLNSNPENNDEIRLHEKDKSDSEFYDRNNNRGSEVTPSGERTIDNDEISNSDSNYDKTIENINQIKDVNQIEDANKMENINQTEDVNQMEDINQTEDIKKDGIVSNNDNSNNNSVSTNEDNQLKNENSQDNIVEQSIVDDSNAISQNNYNKPSQNPVFEYGEEKLQVQKNEPNKEVNNMPDNVKSRNIKLNIKSSSKFNNNSSNNRDVSNGNNMSNNSNVNNNNEPKKSEKELEAERRKKMSSESFEDKFGY